MTLREYVDSLQNKTVAVLGIGVSNTPLVRLLLDSGIRVTACDKRTREELGALTHELEGAGCTLRLGPDYLEGLHEDVIFRTPGLRPDVPHDRGGCGQRQRAHQRDGGVLPGVPVPHHRRHRL